MFKLMDKKIIAILSKLFLLNWPYGFKDKKRLMISIAACMHVFFSFYSFGEDTPPLCGPCPEKT